MTAMCYIGRMTVSSKRHAAGMVVCATVDDQRHPKDTAKAIAQWVRTGLTVERVPVEWARQHLLTAEPAP